MMFHMQLSPQSIIHVFCSCSLLSLFSSITGLKLLIDCTLLLNPFVAIAELVEPPRRADDSNANRICESTCILEYGLGSPARG
ncbi:hypothetical protein BCR35DRAFT_303244 [Leucosporidium creatinivorum]|uniref:Uncharacterized protein n=1 Tax=Leucosporidium creatinivorum TaxID=106004 RepID=A0A1Y2FJN2_9BASI|nr:hypothetical protein BCR35DRAFT_303244 [Leucosporidium creatinivorum]